MKKKGFTLIELLIVVAIIGILAAVGAAVIPGLIGNTKNEVVKVNHSTIVSTLEKEIIICDMEGKIDRIQFGPGLKFHHSFKTCRLAFSFHILNHHFLGLKFKNPYKQIGKNSNPSQQVWELAALVPGPFASNPIIGQNYLWDKRIGNDNFLTLTTKLENGTILYDQVFLPKF